MDTRKKSNWKGKTKLPDLESMQQTEEEATISNSPVRLVGETSCMIIEHLV